MPKFPSFVPRIPPADRLPLVPVFAIASLLTFACLIGCGVLTGIGSVWNRTDLGLGDTCVVFGVGGVGLNCISVDRAGLVTEGGRGRQVLSPGA